MRPELSFPHASAMPTSPELVTRSASCQCGFWKCKNEHHRLAHCLASFIRSILLSYTQRRPSRTHHERFTSLPANWNLLSIVLVPPPERLDIRFRLFRFRNSLPLHIATVALQRRFSCVSTLPARHLEAFAIAMVRGTGSTMTSE